VKASDLSIIRILPGPKKATSQRRLECLPHNVSGTSLNFNLYETRQPPRGTNVPFSNLHPSLVHPQSFMPLIPVSSSTLDKILEQLIPVQKSKCRDDESMGTLFTCKQRPPKINQLKIMLLAAWRLIHRCY
jgi:hypothetical protein